MFAFSTSNGDLQPNDGPAGSDDGFSTVTVSLSRFMINTQLWYEISDLFYTHTVWTYPSVEVARTCLLGISDESRSKICKIAVTVSYEKLGELAIRPGKDLVLLLFKLPRLRVLTVQVRLEAFHTSKSSWEMAVHQRPSGETDQVAAKWIHQFVKQGLETRLPFQEKNLSRYFIDELKRLCGEKNVRLEPAGRDRYAGNLVHIVIGSSGPTRPRTNPTRLASFERVSGLSLRKLIGS